jgi:predicted dehydrogenase
LEEIQMPYNVALIGAGVWSKNHLTGWRAQSDVNISWVVRSTQARAEQMARAYGVANWSADYKAVIERDDVDIVDILLPHDMHAEVACLAIERGKHVVLEKPLATNLKDARRIAEMARIHKRTVMISENWIYSDWVQKARSVIEAGEIGEPIMLRSTMDMDVRPGFSGLDWRYSAERMGGGALLDGGTHPVSASRYLMGEIREVAALMNNFTFPEISPLEDTIVLLTRYDSGATGTLTIAWGAQRERPRTEFVVLGTQGTIEFDTFERRFFVTREKKRCEQFELLASRGFVEQIAHFIECLRENRDPITSPEDQIKSLKVILAAYKAAESGQFVRVSDMGE